MGYARLELLGNSSMEAIKMMPLRTFILTFVFAVVAAVHSQSAFAAFGITSVLGATELAGPPPPGVHPGDNEGALPIVFPEVLGGTVSAGGLDVDHNGSNVVATPVVTANVVNPLLIDATIPAGARFNSYMVHFDPVGDVFFEFYNTTIKFDNPIIGVQLFSSAFDLEKPVGTAYVGTLEQGDAEIVANSAQLITYYPGGLDYRGVEEDSFLLAIGAGNEVIVAGSVGGAEIDHIRILTTSPIPGGGIPEPASALTWTVLSLIGSGAFLRRRG